MDSTCMFPGCKKQRYVRNGHQHDYCGRTHAEAHLGRKLDAPHGSCHECALPGCNKPVFFEKETGRVHDYCCYTHAQQGMSKGVLSQSSHTSTKRCALPGCADPVSWDEDNQRFYDYCGRSHAIDAKQKKMLPPPSPHIDRVFGGDGFPYTISLIKKTHNKYEDIKVQFHKCWKKPGNPQIKRIYSISPPAENYKKHEEYKSSRGNVVRRFHGTRSADDCWFGVNIGSAPCNSEQCAVCNICQKGFDVTLSGTATKTLRYGPGLYFSSTSGKSNDYGKSKNHARKSVTVFHRSELS
eukprot:TRINITY_DN6126_c0_g1_i2.p1 TRINITY_DN6126_c0_g1~~TRINITY_DN6126_c0_g1_i2.p1  ORF type:complete len:296 (-),score=30.82 TRINITY_DN6126_c0_g1_i2:332-1219(-)